MFSIKIESSITLDAAISRVLLSYQNNSTHRSKPSLYSSKFVPGISLANYIKRISHYASIKDNVLSCALVYIDRYLIASKMKMTSHETHRLFLIAVIIAAKFHYDEYYDNQFYADVGGITMEEFNELERDFLETIDYSLMIDEKLYLRYIRAISSYKEVYSISKD